MTNVVPIVSDVDKILKEAQALDFKFVVVLGVGYKGTLDIRMTSMPIELLCYLKEVINHEVANQIGAQKNAKL